MFPQGFAPFFVQGSSVGRIRWAKNVEGGERAGQEGRPAPLSRPQSAASGILASGDVPAAHTQGRRHIGVAYSWAIPTLTQSTCAKNSLQTGFTRSPLRKIVSLSHDHGTHTARSVTSLLISSHA
jgi:hypothetical protein